MKVQLLCSFNGPKGHFKTGDIIEVMDNEGKSMIEGGNAIAVEEPKKRRGRPKKQQTEE